MDIKAITGRLEAVRVSETSHRRFTIFSLGITAVNGVLLHADKSSLGLAVTAWTGLWALSDAMGWRSSMQTAAVLEGVLAQAQLLEPNTPSNIGP